MFQADYSRVADVRVTITASGLAEAVITWETVSGHATTSSTGATLVSFPRRPLKFIGELTGYTAEISPAGDVTMCSLEIWLLLLLILTWFAASAVGFEGNEI